MARNTSKQNIKFSYNRTLLYALICLLVLLAIGIAVKVTQNLILLEKEKVVECVMQQTGCCSCSMGGQEECMTKEQAQSTQNNLDTKCQKGIVCIAMYNCEENVTCIYSNGSCTKHRL